MRRRKLVAAVGLAVLVAVGAFALWPRTDRITLENYDRIHQEMTRAEVEAILGPPGDYRTRATACRGVPDRVRDFDETDATTDDKQWDGDGGSIHVDYGRAGTVVYVTYREMEEADQGPLDVLLWRAKRLWRRWFPD
jgi:hypothetical protein